MSKIAAAFLLTAGFSSAAHATAIATTAQLSVPVPSVAVGVPTLLVATVTDASSQAVLLGTVTFYDGNRALGSAQIVSRAGGSFTQGTANLKTASLTPGANSITAVFAGTIADLTSTSPAQTVTVTGKSQTTTVLSAAISQDQYTLTAALRTSGAGVPTGSVDFLDTTTDTTLGTVPMSGIAWNGGLLITNMPEIGSYAASVTTADFNGDGFLDLATTSVPVEQNVITVALGNGDGAFNPQPTTYLLEDQNSPSPIVVGDFNGDGVPDLAVVNPDFGSVGIFLGNGDGTFQSQGNYGTSTDPVTLVVGDFNRDGKLDLATANGAGSNVSVLLGNGDGTFQAHHNYGVSSNPGVVAVGDLNGDGIPDLLVRGSTSNTVGQLVVREDVLLGKGDGTFTSFGSYVVNGLNLALADVNGDGKLDRIASTTSSVDVSLGNGDGTFKAATSYPVTDPGPPLILDINQDGKLDIALPGQGIQVLLGNGDGTFRAPAAYLSSTQSYGPLIQGDMNGDGLPDLVAPIAKFETVMVSGQTATVQLLNVAAPVAGPEVIQATYSDDGSRVGSASNQVTLNPVLDGISVQLNGGAVVDASGLHLTNGGAQETTSAFTATPVSILQFTTDFNFQILNPHADGFTFTIQNDSPGALGGSGSGLGYSDIPRSVAIKFDLYNNAGEGSNSTGLYIDGARPTQPSIDLTGSGIDLHSGDPFKAHITYDSTYLIMTLTDTVTLASWSHAWQASFDNFGGAYAWVGFTAATGAQTSAVTIDAWTYTAGPPAAPNYPIGFDRSNITVNGTGSVDGTLELSFIPNQDTTGFYNTQQNIQTFINDFTFQIENFSFLHPVADGFTFVIQNDKLGALGGGGSGLGYSDIPKSVAIKFDLYNNAGEGPDSTGLYINGARPTVPAIDLTGTGIDLHGGDIFKAHMTYDGTNLTMTLTDTVTLAVWSHSWPIDIPATVGGNTAWVGFSGATGADYAIQSILTWTFVPGAP